MFWHLLSSSPPKTHPATFAEVRNPAILQRIAGCLRLKASQEIREQPVNSVVTFVVAWNLFGGMEQHLPEQVTTERGMAKEIGKLTDAAGGCGALPGGVR